MDDIFNPFFESARLVHDWRNYVPSEFKEAWDKLTVETRQAIIIMASIQADNEEWD